MNAVDQILVQAFQTNPILGALLGVLMDGGRIVSTSDKISELLSMVPDVFFFEQKNIDIGSEASMNFLSDYNYKDLIFLDEKNSVDVLWKIAHVSGAQIAQFSQKGSDESLCDYVIEEKDLRSALMNIRGIWEKLKEFKGQISFDGSRMNKALFLDRDGVVIEDGEYLQNPDEVKLMAGIIPMLKQARALGFRLFVVTNQSGIGRGMFNFAVYEKVNDRMLQLLMKEGVLIDRVLKAPYFEKSQYASGLVRKSLRKPRPAMLHEVTAEFRIDLAQSAMIGDSARDLMAAAVSGVSKVFLVESKKTNEQSDLWKQWPLRSRFESKESVFEKGNLDQALKFLDKVL